jgi:uncharacterized OsmC-like protein
MVTMRATYDGDLRCAPKDNHGKGESFSPTDLVATALMTCATTIIAIVARNEGIAVGEMSAVVQKTMAADPRRIAAAPVAITIHGRLTDAEKRTLEHAARHCPVAMSLRADLDGSMVFHYPADDAPSHDA